MPVVVINLGVAYWNVILFSVLIGLSQIFIGGTVSIILCYLLSTSFEDLHIALLTVGYHFFSVEAILSLNYANGWSTPMKLRHRRFTHVFLQMCAMTCAITGTVLIVISKGLKLTPHGVTGYVTTALACVSFLSGPCALFGKHYMKILHQTFGIPTFIMSSICFCFGLFTPAFKEWAAPGLVYILLAFIILYTTFIVFMCITKCLAKIINK